MFRRSLLFALIFFISSCSIFNGKFKKLPVSDLDSDGNIRDLDKILKTSEDNASSEARGILITGRAMVENKKIVRGSCWDYANTIYNKSGYKVKKRVTALKSQMAGPYAELSSIRPGDWLYFINHSFNQSEHSGIFIEWTDFDNHRAVILSYVGGRKKKPGSYKIYDLRNVYHIIRPGS